MKMYFIFAVICFINPDANEGASCVNFWEENKPTYKAAKCYERAEEVGDEIMAKFRQDNIKVMEHIIWCVNSKGEVI